MTNLKLVIKGAFYFNRKSNTILMPHFTGEYSMVDCDSFELMSELVGKYDESYIDSVKNEPIKFEDKKYYSTEYSPFTVSDEWELLSDLSGLSHLEEDYDF